MGQFGRNSKFEKCNGGQFGRNSKFEKCNGGNLEEIQNLRSVMGVVLTKLKI